MEMWMKVLIGGMVALLAGIAIDFATGTTVAVEGTVRATSFQPSTSGVSTGPTVGYDGGVGTTTMVTTTSEKRTVVVDTVGGFVEAEAAKDVFWSLDQGHAVTIQGRVGRFSGAAYGWKVQ